MARVDSRSATLAGRERLAALRSRGVEVISLVGGPTDFDVAAEVKSEIVAALGRGPLHPSPSAGLEELRRALADDYAREQGVELDPAGLVVTVGAKEATMALMMALLDPGDEVVLPDPAWVGYEPWIRRAGAVPVRIGIGKSTGFRLDPDELRRALSRRTRLLILTTPHNPTGTVFSRDELRAIGDALSGTNALVVADESNCRIVFDGLQHVSPLTLSEFQGRTVLLRSFSKSFAMPGWRIGYAWAPASVAEAVLAAHEHAVSSVATLVQLAALAVIRSPATDEVIARMLAELTRRRTTLVSALNAILGVTCHLPQGAFNAFPDFSAVATGSAALADRLLEAGVVVVPGSAFGALGEGHLRLSFAGSEASLLEAARRIATVIDKSRTELASAPISRQAD